MKHKKASRAAIIMAAALVITITTALTTNAVTAAVESGPASAAQADSTYMVAQANESYVGDPTDYVELYAPYAEYGLTYNPENGRLYYKGELVRYFEDMYPVGDGASAGSVMQCDDGMVDVHGVRDLTQLKRNPDGSYDPSGKLIGVEPYTQAEFDARTKRLAEAASMVNATVLYDASSGGVAMQATYTAEDVKSAAAEDEAPNSVATHNTARIEEGVASGNTANIEEDVASGNTANIEEGVASGNTAIQVPNLVGTSMDDIEWWTAEEYEAWLNEQREELPKRIGERAYTGQRGWFVWTQEDVDDALAMYESILSGIKSGTKVSKSVGGRDDIVMMSSGDAVFGLIDEVTEITTEARAEIEKDIDVVTAINDTLDAYARSAWKMDYDALTLHSEAWHGRVFLCDGVVTEVRSDAEGQTFVMDVNLSGEGEPQYVVLANYSSLVTPEIGERYKAYADVTGSQIYGNKLCPTLTCRYMIKP